MSKAQFEAGDEVRYTGNKADRYFSHPSVGDKGVVIKTGFSFGDEVATVKFANGHERKVFQFNIELVKPKAPKFATAWLNHGELTYTGNTFFTQADADNFANAEVASNADTEMVVVQMVSKHSSSVKVTSEKL